jgi:hypothetical protein
MTSALVIGNGESRSAIDLSLYLQKFITFGCNAISRDYKVDHLVCCDKRMVLESIPKRMPNIYTRADWYPMFNLECVKQLPDLPYAGSNRADDPFHWGSGPYAVLLATDFADDIHMIGFDLYGIAGTVNNIYKSTPNYKKEGSSSVDPSYWIYQISKVFELFPDKYFTIYNNDWVIPESWKMKNISFKTLDKLPLTV